MRLQCERFSAAGGGRMTVVKPDVPVPRAFRSVLPALRVCFWSGVLFSQFAFAFQNGRPSQQPQGSFTASGGSANSAGAQGAFISSGGRANTAAAQAPVGASVAAAGPAAEDADVGLAGVDRAVQSRDSAALRRYLSDTDAAVQAAAFEQLAADDERSAIRDLSAIIRDRSEPARGQALQLLVNSPEVDEATARAALRSALADPDPLMSEFAADALAALDAAAARGAANQAGSQGPFRSSGGAANTAGPQGKFVASGAPANTAGAQIGAPPAVVSPER